MHGVGERHTQCLPSDDRATHSPVGMWALPVLKSVTFPSQTAVSLSPALVGSCACLGDFPLRWDRLVA